ncbi:RsfA family transcriptional regulator [Brevibacillus humidisoli]|uniref:RsfA family transcriptional regulator n=1 Tax=Brevibacillus humidisoli TaxID=2895522 RepID=UPI001E30CC61|nr:RsfA family transcriptional regulator [Brevibacillus humidisoli]UFJ41899.1 RsfA family transcriptional regulator [Brevibacillus humidisoli]
MVASRQDAWTEDDDLVLAEVTLRHIREGGTQLAAFEEVGQRLGRTAAACGFRWNSTVRKRYEQAIAIAKSQRQQLKKTGKLPQGEPAVEFSKELTLQDYDGHISKRMDTGKLDEEQQLETAIRVLSNQRELLRRMKQLERELGSKHQEVKELKEENSKLKKELSEIHGVNEDYKALIQIMERARKLAFLQEEEAAKPVFKMDANGNLERVE